MTSPSDPKRPSKRPSREPPTIDLKATEVKTSPPEAAPEEPPRDEGKASAKADDSAPASAQTSVYDAPPTGASPTEAERSDAVTEGMLEGAPAQDPASPVPAASASAGEGSASDAESAATASADAAPAAAGSDPSPARSALGSRPAEPARRSGPGFGSLAAASLLGGLVGAGAMLAFQSAQPTGPVSDPRVAEIERRIGALPSADTGALDRRLTAIEGAQNGLNQRIQAAQTLAERGAARAEEAFNRQPSQAQAPQPPQNNPAVAELGNRLGALEGQLRQQGEQARQQGETATRERQALTQGVEAAATAIAGVERRVGEIDRRLADQERRAADQDRRTGDQEGRVAALARDAQGATAAQQAGTRLVLANRLDAALRDGAPYADVLDGLRRLGTDPARLQALELFAGGGAPSAAALAQSFKPLNERVAEEAKPAPAAAPGTWTDRLVGLVGQVVSIRPVAGEGAPEAAPPGSPAGGSPSAVEQALARGDLAAAASAWDALPEPARQASADWGRQLKQRAAAEAASRALAADAVAALNTPTR